MLNSSRSGYLTFTNSTYEPSVEQLEAYFKLKPRDPELIWANSRHLMRVLSRNGERGGLGRAVQKVRRVAKTLVLLKHLDDPSCRRQILAALNAGETRNDLYRTTAYGGKDGMWKPCKAGIENQLGALGFVVNSIVP